jgi:hypothetical protein
MALELQWLTDRLEEILAARASVHVRTVTADNALEAYQELSQEIVAVFADIEWLSLKVQLEMVELRAAVFEQRLAESKSQAIEMTKRLAELPIGGGMLSRA